MATEASDKHHRRRHIVLNSHPSGGQSPIPINWGADNPGSRGPVVTNLTAEGRHNAIGTHSGSYSIYRALAVAAGALDPSHRPDLTNTAPVTPIGPHRQWSEPHRIVSLDPYGHLVTECFETELRDGLDIRPSIAVTRARLSLPELMHTNTSGLAPDGTILLESGEINVTKVALEPVWHLPGVAARFELEEHDLRRILYEQTGGMFSDLVTRNDLKVFLPPIGGATVYIFGNPEYLVDERHRLTCRVHDECNGSDVFGSDICTCRPYLVHGIEECVREAQKDGVGLVVYNRKEGRALGEVTKFLVYNARKRQIGGDRADAYFERTECVAGVQDVRFQELMPDVLNWLGITRIDRFVSMSNMKYDALVAQGIQVGERVSLPDSLIPDDAQVEMEAKKAAGYFTSGDVLSEDDLAKTRGRQLESY